MLRKTNISMMLLGILGGAFAAPPVSLIPINTVQNLEQVQTNLAGHYVLMKDLNLAGVHFKPIGSGSEPFTGRLDGKGHVIKNLVIKKPKTRDVGLFAKLGQGAIVKNLQLKNANVTGWYSTGILTGSNAGTIRNVFVSGNVNGQANTGGMVGVNNAGQLNHCSADVTVTAQGDFAGGLVGGNSEGSISHCFVIATVNAETSNHVGGLMGDNYNGRVQQVYALGAVSGQDDVGGLTGGNDMGEISNAFADTSVNASGMFIGGLSGDNVESGSLNHVYALGHVAGQEAVGGLVGYSEGSVQNAYWDIDTSGQNISGGGEGKTDLEMRQQETYKNWDFDKIWQMQDYPNLNKVPYVLK